MIWITGRIAIDEAEMVESFVCASGPGGQNVNKVATAVQLRFDARHSPTLTDAVRARLALLAGRRLTRDGVIVIIANRHRTQERNRRDARERLIALIQLAAQTPRTRRPTRATASSRQRRLEAKGRRSQRKMERMTPPSDD